MRLLDRFFDWFNYGSRKALYGISFVGILATCAIKLHTLHMQNQTALQRPIIAKIQKLETSIRSTIEMQIKRIESLRNEQKQYAANAEKLLSDGKVDEAIQQYKKEIEALESILAEISAMPFEKHYIEIQKLEAEPSILPEIRQGFAETELMLKTVLPKHEENKNKVVKMIADKKALIKKLER